VQGASTTKSYPIVGKIVITEYTKPSTIAVFKTCSLYAIKGATCGQSDIDCEYSKYAKIAEKELQDGTCASQGYTVQGASTTKSYPIVGKIVITEYTKPSTIAVFKTCSLYAIKGATCGQSDINCMYSKYAKMATPGLKDGTCGSEGYTEEVRQTTRNVPVLGEVDVTIYKKPSETLLV